MKRSSRHRLIAGTVTVAVCGGLYWFVGALGLAIAAGILSGSALAVTLRIGRQHPTHTTGTAWKDKRWTAFSVAVITFSTGIGINTLLSIPIELRIGLIYLVLVTGWLAYATGAIAELERTESQPNTPQQTTETGPTRSDIDSD